MTIRTVTENRFDRKLAENGQVLGRAALEVLQVNVGRICNQSCHHCHVSAGPWRTELMDLETAEACVRFLDETPSIHTIDITGGAPEMAPVFRHLVCESRARRKQIIDRCNLTILMQPGYESLARFLADHQVHIIASLPCYTMENVDSQRGDGAFTGSIAGLRRLNALGYGCREGDSPLRLDLIYNPLGPSLPPDQGTLEMAYREQLRANYAVVFDHLLALTNLPVGRFRGELRKKGRLGSYIDLLEVSYNPATVGGLMCRTFLSVDYEGNLFDCDFNQMLGMHLGHRRPINIRDITAAEISELPIATGDHCLGCSAGCGSSCGGALT